MILKLTGREGNPITVTEAYNSEGEVRLLEELPCSTVSVTKDGCSKM